MVASRVGPDGFLIIAKIAVEWSLATDGPDIYLYARYIEGGEIKSYVGPNSFAYPYSTLIGFSRELEQLVKERRSYG